MNDVGEARVNGFGEVPVNGIGAEEGALDNAGTGEAAVYAADSLPAVMARHLREGADRVFLICPETERTLTFGQLALAARRQSRGLRAAGRLPGDHIALLLPGGFDTVTLCLSCMLNGYVPVPLSLLAADTALAWIIAHSGAKIVMTCRDYAPRLRGVLNSLPRAERPVMVIRERDMPASDRDHLDSEDLPPQPINDPISHHSHPADDLRQADDAITPNSRQAGDLTTHQRLLNAHTPALLIYTSGTTGKPKGVVLTHGNVLAAAERIARWHHLTARDRLLCALPLYHINGQIIGTLVPFVTGGSLVAPGRFSVSRWWNMVERYRCTWLNLVPTMIAFLLHGAPDNNPDGNGDNNRDGNRDNNRDNNRDGKPDGNSAGISAGNPGYPWVKFARSASAPLSPTQHRQFEQRFGIPVIEGMGMTESGSLAFCNPHNDRVYGSVGLPCGIEAAVAGAGGELLGDNNRGEILLRGPNIMAGYYRDRPQTAAAIDGRGWLHSGDLGYRDPRGFYFITGRMKEIIIKGGENIAPREIDEALADFPCLREAAAFAIPDADYGQNIAAALVLHSGMALDEAGLRAWCLERLGSYKVPARFYIVEALPRGGSGKLQRLALSDRFANG